VKPIDHLPEIGESIIIGTEGQWIPAVCISMAECRKLQPSLWRMSEATMAATGGWRDDTYKEDDVIRAYKFADGDGAGFCIMRFGEPGRYEYNKNVRMP